MILRPEPEAQFPSAVPPSPAHSWLVRQVPRIVGSETATHGLFCKGNKRIKMKLLPRPYLEGQYAEEGEEL